MGYVLHQNGFLSYVVTKNKVSANFTTFLATSCPRVCTSCSIPVCFGSVFPDAASRYPNSSVELTMQTTSRPSLTITTSSAAGTFRGTINAGVRLLNGTLIPNLVSLNVTIVLEVTPGMTGKTITAAVKKFTPTVSIINSKLGNPSSATLNTIINYIANSTILSNLNNVGKKGFDIPAILHVGYVNPTVMLVDGAVVVAADVAYIP